MSGKYPKLCWLCEYDKFVHHPQLVKLAMSSAAALWCVLHDFWPLPAWWHCWALGGASEDTLLQQTFLLCINSTAPLAQRYPSTPCSLPTPFIPFHSHFQPIISHFYHRISSSEPVNTRLSLHHLEALLQFLLTDWCWLNWSEILLSAGEALFWAMPASLSPSLPLSHPLFMSSIHNAQLDSVWACYHSNGREIFCPSGKQGVW